MSSTYSDEERIMFLIESNSPSENTDNLSITEIKIRLKKIIKILLQEDEKDYELYKNRRYDNILYIRYALILYLKSLNKYTLETIATIVYDSNKNHSTIINSINKAEMLVKYKHIRFLSILKVFETQNLTLKNYYGELYKKCQINFSIEEIAKTYLSDWKYRKKRVEYEEKSKTKKNKTNE
jgi:hypothetical protein